MKFLISNQAQTMNSRIPETIAEPSRLRVEFGFQSRQYVLGRNE